MVVGVGSDPESVPIMRSTHAGSRQVEWTAKGVSDVAKSPAKVWDFHGKSWDTLNENPLRPDLTGNPNDLWSEIESGTQTMAGIAPLRTRDASMERIQLAMPGIKVHDMAVSFCHAKGRVAMPENGTLMRVVLDCEGWTVAIE